MLTPKSRSAEKKTRKKDMDTTTLNKIFSEKTLKELFPPSRSVEFFEALFGDNEEGAYDIALAFKGCSPDGKQLDFVLELHERPGKCLACNLTQGLPQVFARHPIINIQGLVEAILEKLGDKASCESWQLGRTHQESRSLHTVPLTINLA